MSKLETDSDSSEEFFDAEDTTPNRHATLRYVSYKNTDEAIDKQI